MLRFPKVTLEYLKSRDITVLTTNMAAVVFVRMKGTRRYISILNLIHVLKLLNLLNNSFYNGFFLQIQTFHNIALKTKDWGYDKSYYFFFCKIGVAMSYLWPLSYF